jgi:plastocyanin
MTVPRRNAMPRLLLATVLVALALGAAACGDDEENAAQPTTTPVGAAGAQAPSGGVTVTMGDNVFRPAQLTAKVGTEVTWKNSGQVSHNVTAREGEDFKSDTMEPGDTYEYTLDEAGTISYECTFHPGMTGSITVEE